MSYFKMRGKLLFKFKEHLLSTQFSQENMTGLRRIKDEAVCSFQTGIQGRIKHIYIWLSDQPYVPLTVRPTDAHWQFKNKL